VTDAPKKARRDHAREVAREMREKERKRRLRNRILLQVGVVVAIVAVVGAGYLLYTSSIKAPVDGPANMASDGILLEGDGSGNIVAVPNAGTPAGEDPTPTDQSTMTKTANITMYVDYLCPVCGAFEGTNAQQIGTWVSAGIATVEIHPISILDRSSQGTRYSTRAANAMACVANYNPNAYFQANTALYNAQPAEETPGLTDDEIISALAGVSASSPEIEQCIADETYSDWVTAATTRTRSAIPNSTLAAVTGTPTVIVNGQQYTGSVTDAQAFSDFIRTAAPELFSSSN
jgi:protein-disulfide isomerase